MKRPLTYLRSDPGAGPLHGGDRSALRSLARLPESAWLDLSTGINPWSYPLPEIPAERWQRLPEASAETAFAEAARHYYGLAGAVGLAAAPGSQALIQWLPRLLPRAAVAVGGFTYKEHARAWAAAGHDLLAAEDGRIPAEAAIVVLVNPNNPDGTRHAPRQLAELARRLHDRGGLLVVDEAFADLAPELSLAGQLETAADAAGLVVLRSFGKFFGLGGLRLGCAFGDPTVTARLAEALGPWALSGPALEIATRAFADTAWIAATRQRLREAARRLEALLAAAGLEPLGGTDLYRLAAHPEAPALFERLCRAGILVRRFPERPAWLRFGLPPDGEAERRLADTLGVPAAAPERR
ncbi:L-threonine O-3-phosphate decarboxylase [Tistlia consotensis]|uniref:threonine-phosphate decarboxylase n=1 Tax=Tistlia consotensis USBA 355 TaxID=560819 RepID=A0A1Y6BXL0_9PROT|nr:threonine-phosphate decarboxylase CobD [Tistlia consotensis]SMF33119.1 L-threonine O-3-phosphate decarboxylase [Tistlia consotensis USBA 355]SNR69397.1 L-threonine O-3-phosphate decarboxylase [Tistlia consotensis]